MKGLNRSNCAFALDGLCRLAQEECATCKLTPADSDFHRTLCIGGLTYDEVEAKCGGRLRDDIRRMAKREGGAK